MTRKMRPLHREEQGEKEQPANKFSELVFSKRALLLFFRFPLLGLAYK